MSAQYSLGTAEGTIKIAYDGKGIIQAQKGMETLESKAKSVQQRYSSLATTTGVATAALAAGLGLAVNSAIDFEKRISAIGAVSGATADQLEIIRSKALKLGADTAFSASEAALAMEELAKAGLSVDDIMNGAADATVALAAAGEVALPEAAAIASNAMNAFGLAAEQLPRIADLIAGAANASAIDVTDFGMSLAQAGAVAKLAGLSFDDLAVAIALMGNAGIKGSDAGTSLKTMLQNLIPQTDKEIALFKKLGLITKDGANQFFDATGKVKSLADISGVLQHALQGMTEEQKLANLQVLFGSDAIRGAAILAEQGADGFNKMAAAMGEVSAQQVAEQRMNNVAGAIEQLKGSVETAAIQLGTTLLPLIRKLADFITNLVNAFSGLSPFWQKFIAFGLLAAAVVLGLITVIATVVAAVAGFIAVFGGMGPIIGIILGVVAGVAALAAGIIALWKNSEGFRTFIKNLGASIVALAKDLGERLSPILDAVASFFKDRIIPAVEKLQQAFEKAWPTIKTLLTVAIAPLVVAVKILGSVLGWLIPIILDIAGPVFSLLIDVIAWLIGDGLPGLVAILKFVGGIFAEIFGFIWLIVSTVFEEIMAIIMVFVALLKAVWDPLWKYIIEPVAKFLTPVWEFIKKIFEAIWEVIKFVLDLIWSYSVGFWNVLVDLFKGSVKILLGIWDGIKEIVQKVKNFFGQLKEAASGGIGSLIEFVKTIPGKIVDALAELGQKMLDAGKSIIQGIWDGMKDRWTSVISWFKDKLGGLRDLLPFSPAKEGPFSGRGYTLYSGQAMIEDWAKGMASKGGDVEAAMRDIVESVASQLPQDRSALVAESQANLATSTGSGSGGAPAPNQTTTTTNNITIKVPMDDLRSIRDVQDFLDFVDRMRNDSRRGIQEEVLV